MSMALNSQGFLVTMFDGPTRVTFTYDANGNMLTENRGGIITTYSYGREDRLSVKNDNGTRTTMTYNGDGQRITRQTGSALTTFIWDGSDYIQEKTS